jgi:CBS domain-containing protein
MKVQDLMTPKPVACAAWADVGFAAHLMWNTDCGSLPVVDENDHLVGMVTDRDICIALATRDTRASELPVSQVMSRDVHYCHAGEDLGEALETMRKQRIRRIPVIHEESDEIVGVLSLADVIAKARPKTGRASGPTFEEAMATLKAIGEKPPVTSRV